jgi:endonuclease YncB( thermonuclease family)
MDIVDGDTLKASCRIGGHVTVRLSGIDAPEHKQPHSKASTEALHALCFKVQATIKPKTTDRYRRTVADVECGGKDVAAEQVKAGMAWVYVQYDKGHEALYPLQDAAQAARLGLWADPAPIPPWEWRRR